MKKAIAVVLSLMFVFALTSISFAAEKKMGAKHVTGEVAAVDANAKTVSVKAGKHEVVVSVDDKTKISMGKETKTLADVTVGETVSVKYTEAGGKNTAESIDLHAAKKHEAAPAAVKKK
jgi:hypothetical protein